MLELKGISGTAPLNKTRTSATNETLFLAITSPYVKNHHVITTSRTRKMECSHDYLDFEKQIH